MDRADQNYCGYGPVGFGAVPRFHRRGGGSNGGYGHYRNYSNNNSSNGQYPTGARNRQPQYQHQKWSSSSSSNQASSSKQQWSSSSSSSNQASTSKQQQEQQHQKWSRSDTPNYPANFSIELTRYWTTTFRDPDMDSIVPIPEPEVLNITGLIINDMNEDCMILVLRNFSIQELVMMRLVCVWWRDVIDGIFFSKKSLKVFGTKDDVFIYCKELPKFNLHRNDDFILRSVGDRDDDLLCRRVAFMTAIPEIFPKLKRLSICHYQKDYPWQLDLPNILAQMPNLESLTLFGLGYNIKEVSPKFWFALNSMRKLKELHLLDCAYFRMPYDMWVLNYLTKFTLTEYPQNIGAIIQMLGPRTTHLLLDNVHISMQHLQSSFDANWRLQTYITHLTIGTFKTNEGKVSWLDLFRLIGERFKALTHLDILLYQDIRFYDVTTELSKLPLLQELSINIGWINPANHLENIGLAPRMLTLKRLLLKDFILLPAEEFIHNFPRIFPKLTYLQLESLSDQFLETVQQADPHRLFPSLLTYKPVGALVHNRANRNKVLYAYAGRHEKLFQAHMYEELPSFDRPENKHDELLEGIIYSEGEGDDGELIAAVFA